MKINLKTVSFGALILSIIVQLLLICCTNVVQTSDAGYNLTLANDCINSGKMYPFEIHRYVNYIYANGFINLSALLMSIFGSIKAVFIANVVMLLIVSCSMYYILKNYFSERVANLFLMLFALYPSNYGMILWLYTEPMFMMLAYLAFALFVKGGTKNTVISGILFALMNWTRPFLPVFLILIPIVSYFYNKQTWLKKCIMCFTATVVSIFVIGCVHKKTFGDFIYQPSTGGINLIIGANDDANGCYDDTVFQGDHIGVLPTDSLTYSERDRYWKSQSINWIKSNPIKWVSLFPKKLFFLYFRDSHVISILYDDIHLMLNTSPKMIFEYLINDFPCYSKNQIVVVVKLCNELYYFVMLLLSLAASIIFILRKHKMGIVFILWILLTTGLTIITVGSPRYHYPLMPIFVFMGAYMIDYIWRKLINHKQCKK